MAPASWKIPLALALGVVLCELGLRAASLTADQRADVSGPELGPEGRTIVCVGDSNTYGTNEDVEDTYPHRLGELLDARVPGGPHRVVNLGVPGYGSHQVAADLPAVLERERPDVVLVLAGVNDLWRFDEASSLPPWYEELRLVKLLRLLGTRFGAASGSVDAPALDGEGRALFTGESLRPRDLETREEGHCERIAAALGIVRELCARAGARPVVLTYAWDRSSCGQSNECLRRAAADLELPLVDCGAGLAPFREQYPRDDMYWRDGHPRALGYELFARVVYRGLLEAELISGEPFDELGTDLATRAWSHARARVRVEGPNAVVEVEGEEPGRRFQVMLSLDSGERAQLGGRTLPVFDDELFRLGFQGPHLRGAFDADGRTRVRLEDLGAIAAGLGGDDSSVRIVVAVLDRGKGGRIARLLPLVEVRTADLR